MKRLVLALLLVATSAVAVGAIYFRVRPVPSEADCSLVWLTQELHLDATQRAKIVALHSRYCPSICQLGEAAARAGQPIPQSCRLATQQLVEAVSAELTPGQRARYRELVAPCLQSGGACKP